MTKPRRYKPRPSAALINMAANEFRPLAQDVDLCAGCIFLEIGEVCKDCGMERKK